MNISKFAKSAVLTGALLGAPLSLELHAERDTADILVDVLVMKGILTEEEAASIRQEVAEVAAAERELVVESAVAAASTSAPVAPSAPAANAVPMPKALDGLKLYGDARFRFQAEDVDDASTRQRWRYRARFGADYAFKESPYSMGLRLETSSANDSTNANFGGFFDKTGDEVRLGLVYMKYAGDDVTVQLGKHKHPFKISSAFWDSDINPEGVSESFSAGGITYNLGQYVISEEREDKGGEDDFMFAAQAVWSNDSGLTVAPIFLTTTSGQVVASESASFGGENAISYFSNFDVLMVPVEYKFKGENGIGQKVFGTLGKNFSGGDAVDHFGFPYYNEIDTGDQDMFFNIGYQYGSAKKTGTWQAGIEYRYLEGASYTPNLSDSDFAKNSLNHKGFVLSYKYAVTDFFTAGLTYMDSDLIDEEYTAPVVAKDDVKLLQVDAAVKF
ncbi:putative porin [Pelagicoccus albus]|uniref:Putative porin n=1 Tax=Pelagicoccus albus TaxID=415222 RepID=A0A7X1B3I1_9BACT|nr:putative porin [Pelagicoccus albus]MBC2604973.1 putative porin [Pelagicoccus albus]